MVTFPSSNDASPDVVRLHELLLAADPGSGTTPDAAYAAAAAAYSLAGRSGDRVAFARAWHWWCIHRLRRGEFAEALADAPAASAELEAHGLLAEQYELHYAISLGASEVGRSDVALDSAGRLGTMAAATGDPGLLLRSALLLAVCLERLGDSWQAERVLEDALRDTGHAAPARDLARALNGLAAIALGLFHRLRGTDDELEGRAALERGRVHCRRALALADDVRGLPYEEVITGNLGEMLIHLGELDEASVLLNRAQTMARERRLDPYAWRIAASLGEWWMARGEPVRARDVILELLAELGPQAPAQTVTYARVVAYRACRALGLVDEALAHFEIAERLERIRTTSQLRSQSQLFVTRGEAERARSEAAQHRARAAELAELAERDSLTGLGNRDHLDRRFSELLPEAMREDRPISVAMIDIDHFKQINDSHGHPAGDRVLVQLAGVLRQHLRPADVIVRFGGEEFVVVLPDTAASRAVEICEGLRARLTGIEWPVPGNATVTVSVGVSEAAPYDAVDLLHRADAAMYTAKRLGRDRICRA